MKSVKLNTPIPSAKEIATRLGLSSERQKLIFELVDHKGFSLRAFRHAAPDRHVRGDEMSGEGREKAGGMVTKSSSKTDSRKAGKRAKAAAR
ncbi:MAG TPA: hypothetical protein VGD59_05090 [Acidisarcina sp.]